MCPVNTAHICWPSTEGLRDGAMNCHSLLNVAALSFNVSQHCNPEAWAPGFSWQSSHQEQLGLGGGLQSSHACPLVLVTLHLDPKHFKSSSDADTRCRWIIDPSGSWCRQSDKSKDSVSGKLCFQPKCSLGCSVMHRSPLTTSVYTAHVEPGNHPIPVVRGGFPITCTIC